MARTVADTLERLAFPVTFLVLLAGILVMGGFVVAVAIPGMLGGSSGGTAAMSPSPSPSATSAMALTPIGIAMPPGTDCAACHYSATGGVEVKPIPYLGHPLQGFEDCTACHNPTGLVKTAPGHSGLHANECLICHQENPNLTSMSQIPMRPEHMTGEACTDCHNPSQHGPLPSNMANRGDNCWICHNGPEFQYLFNSPSPGASQAAQAGSPTPSPSPSGSPQPPASYQLEPPATTAP